MTAPTNLLEVKAYFESANYDEDDIPEMINVYTHLIEHVGFEDERKDKRFVVKFPDILYYKPELTHEEDEIYDSLFDTFCQDTYRTVHDTLKDNNFDYKDMACDVFKPFYVGHYRAFSVPIDNITEDTAPRLAIDIFDEFYDGDRANAYIDAYIDSVNAMQALEDNYMDYWLEFLNDNEFPEHLIKQIRDKYEQDKLKQTNRQTKQSKGE